MSNSTAITDSPRATMPDELTAIMAMAEILYKGGIQSNKISRPEHIAARILAGREVGLSAIQSCNNIMLVNGRLTIWGDAAIALVRSSGKLASIEESIEGEDVEAVAVCRVQRVGEDVKEYRFAVTDAVRAGLWGKVGPWTEYPQRQLTMRARSWALRDVFADVLCGLGIVEEVADYKVGVSVPVEAEQPTTNDKAESIDDVVMEPLVSLGQIVRIGEARYHWLISNKIDQDDTDLVRREWRGKLQQYGVESAKQLTASEGERLIRELLSNSDVSASQSESDKIKEEFF